MKNKSNSASFIFFFSALMMLVSCQQKKTEWKGTIEEVDGVTVVKNPKEPMYGDDFCIIEEELSIGEAEGREEYMFSRAMTVAVDQAENIYVGDVREKHVRIFDKKGNFLSIIGKAGQGPGEIGYLRDIQITKKNELMINDSGNDKVHFYSLQGKFIKSLNNNTFAFSILCDSDEQYYAFAYITEPPDEPKYQLLKLDSNFNQSSTIFEYKGQSRFRSKYYIYYLPHLYYHVMENDCLLFGYPEDYELGIYNPEGRLIRKIHREYEPVPVSEEEKERVRERSSQPGGWPIEFPKYHSAYRSLLTDDEGRIYCGTWEKNESSDGYIYDLFDSEGKFIAKLSLDFSPLVWKKGKVYSIEEDEDGYQYVKRYKVTWRY